MSASSVPRKGVHHYEQMWLSRLLLALGAVFACLGCAIFCWYFLGHLVGWLVLGLLCWVSAASQFFAYAQVRRGDMGLALFQHGCVACVLSLVAVVFMPSALSVLLLVPTINVALALPHLGARVLRFLIGVAMLFTALQVVLARWVQPLPYVLQIGELPLLLSALAEVALAFWYLWHYRACLNSLKAATLATNWALRDEPIDAASMAHAASVDLYDTAIPYRSILELTTDYLYSMQLDGSGRVEVAWIAERFAQASGYTAEGLKQAGGWQQLIHPDDWAIEQERHAELVAGHANVREYRILSSASEVRWLRDYRWPGTSSAGVLFMCCAAQDITEQKRAAEQISAINRQLTERVAELQALQETLHFQSTRDALTGLFNRRYMEEALELEVSRGARHQHASGVIMLDIDYFKQFNDAFGHAAGDVLLREVGAFLQQHIRSSDIACRYGGEEFIVIMPEATADALLQRAELLRQGIKDIRPDYHGQPLGPITISAGVALLPPAQISAEAVLRTADQALYRSKRAGRDRVTVGDELCQSRARNG